MASTTVRMSLDAKETLDRLAAETGERPQQVLDRALEAYRRRLFLEKANAAFAALQADPKAWAAEQRERSLWDGATAPVED